MKVHFASSARRLDKYRENYLLICQLITKLGNKLIIDWVEESWLRQRGLIPQTDRKTTYNKILRAVEEMDVLVVEGSIESFSVGYQITMALQREKPILFLVYDAADSGMSIKNELIDGVKSSLIITAKYNFDNLEKILENFFTLYKDGGKFRFNLMLDKDVRYYLNWASGHYKETKSEIIRKLLLEESKKDKDFQKFKKTNLNTEPDD